VLGRTDLLAPPRDEIREPSRSLRQIDPGLIPAGSIVRTDELAGAFLVHELRS
jgi:hypothetical protein